MSAAGDRVPPPGFVVGHWTDSEGATGCTVIVPPAGSTGSVDVRGGGPATRETDVMGPLARADQVTAVVLAGGSAFGLAAATGAQRWLEERGRGYPTPGGPVPIVPAACVYDLVVGRPGVRPGEAEGYAACEAARAGVPETGPVGAGTGTAAGKLLGREGATRTGVGCAAVGLGSGETVAAVAVANPFGDVIAEDGSVLAGPRAEDGRMLRTADLLARDADALAALGATRESTTLACVCTDATLSKVECGAVARMASAGIARAVDPVFSPVDGDVVFCLASCEREARAEGALVVGAAAATAVAAAIRDAVL